MNTRPLTSFERVLLERMLIDGVPGRLQLLKQMATATASSVDDNGSIRFTVADPRRAECSARVPVEAQALDTDDVFIRALLHVLGGVLHELEFYKDDSSPIRNIPPPEMWEIMVA